MYKNHYYLKYPLKNLKYLNFKTIYIYIITSNIYINKYNKSTYNMDNRCFEDMIGNHQANR